MKVEKKTITPEAAKGFLDKSNFNNRSVRKGVVDRLSRDIAAGNWIFDATPIRLNKNGDVIDGQHRLLAIIDAGIAVESLVVSGLDDDAKNTIDTGSARNVGDILHFNGFAQSRRVASVASYIKGLEDFDGDLWRYINSSKATYSNQELLEFVQERPRLRESGRPCDRYVTAGKLSSPTAINVAAYILGKHSGPFFEKFDSGSNLDEGDPILAMRNTFLNNTSKNNGRRDIAIAVGTIIKAWNLWVKDKKISRLKYNPDKEKFPVPIKI